MCCIYIYRYIYIYICIHIHTDVCMYIPVDEGGPVPVGRPGVHRGHVHEAVQGVRDHEGQHVRPNQ